MFGKSIHCVCSIALLGGMLLASAGCESNPTAAAIPASAITRPSEARIQCTCGSWAGGKGAPTQCKKLMQARQAQRKLEQQQAKQQDPSAS